MCILQWKQWMRGAGEFRGCSLNRRVKEASEMRWDLGRDLRQEGLSLVISQAESLPGGGNKAHSSLWAVFSMIWLHFPHFTPQPRNTNGSSASNSSASLSPAPPFLLLIRACIAALSPSTLSITHTTVLLAIWMPNNASGPSPETTSSGVHFLMPARARALAPDGRFEHWVSHSSAAWCWTLSPFLSCYFPRCKMSLLRE